MDWQLKIKREAQDFDFTEPATFESASRLNLIGSQTKGGWSEKYKWCMILWEGEGEGGVTIFYLLEAGPAEHETTSGEAGNASCGFVFPEQALRATCPTKGHRTHSRQATSGPTVLQKTLRASLSVSLGFGWRRPFGNVNARSIWKSPTHSSLFLPSFSPYHLESSPKWEREDGEENKRDSNETIGQVKGTVHTVGPSLKGTVQVKALTYGQLYCPSSFL